MIREEKIEFTTKWCKYSKYNIKKKDDKFYILPDKNAIPNTYDPFEFKNEILRDLLIIGKTSLDDEAYKFGDSKLTTTVQSKKENFQKLVLDFVSNYGLLGNFRYLPKDYNFMDNENIPVVLGYENTTTAKEFESRYFGFDSKINWTRAMKLNDFSRNAGLDDYFKQTEGDRLDDIIFSRNYAETVSEIIDFAVGIFYKKLLVCAFLYDDVSDDIREDYENSITAHKLEKTSISYGIENGQVKFKWNFMSLSAIIETMLLLNETSGRTEVKLCKHCKTPFIAENIKAEYDTPQCRNKENINKSRNRKNNFM